jgi:hypothetical protein
MRRVIVACLVGLCASGAARAETRPHNVILFVADGLRPGMVNAQNAPAMERLMKTGVRFTNTHSMFPTFTMPNATAMATGHMLGDTGQYGNTIYTAFPVPGAGDSLTPFLESDPVLGDVDEHFAGNYLNEETILKAARAKGFSTASIGKLGPSLVFDHTERTGQYNIHIDDSTGRAGGIPLGDAFRARLKEVGLPDQAPTRGANSQAGTAETPGTVAANLEQQAYFASVATKAVLPLFKVRQKPFVLVFWSRDPDGTQHNQGDSLGRLVPGINGPTSLASIRNADDNLAALQAALSEQGLAETTDIVLTSDHGFSTISKESATSFAAGQSYKGVTAKLLPPGFLAIDLAHDLGMTLFDPDAKSAKLEAGAFPSRANGLIGSDPAKPDVVVAANGGSDLVYVPSNDKALARKVVEALSRQDASDRGELPQLLDRLRRPHHLRRRSIGHRSAAGPGHARQLRALRHPQRHGRRGTELPGWAGERHPGEQRRSRQDHRPDPRSGHPQQGQARRPRADRGDGQRRQAGGPEACPPLGAGRCWHRHGAELPDGRRDPVFRRRRISGPDAGPHRGHARLGPALTPDRRAL